MNPEQIEKIEAALAAVHRQKRGPEGDAVWRQEVMRRIHRLPAADGGANEQRRRERLLWRSTWALAAAAALVMMTGWYAGLTPADLSFSLWLMDPLNVMGGIL